MNSDAQYGRRASEGEETGGGQRKNWGEDSREERHPDAEPAPGSPLPAGEERPRRGERDRVDEESEESFPASDPPSFTPEKIG